ncbi:RNA-binding protein [Prochlorococcus sp. AH-716-G04]|nr:RNA-binding protein [Prochlorococcus sp. AH-716-G04]
MIKNILNILLLFLFLIFDTPVYPIDSSQKAIEKYSLKISSKFSNTYCNSIKFGISKDGALRFSIGETNKEFSNSKLNKFIDYELINKNILLSLKNNCKIFDFPEYELDKLAFKN